MSGSWLKRLVGGEKSEKSSSGKRTSTVFESMVEQENRGGIVDQSPPAKRQHAGPPPPKLPELNQLKAKVDDSTGSLGGSDMFANIGK